MPSLSDMDLATPFVRPHQRAARATLNTNFISTTAVGLHPRALRRVSFRLGFPFLIFSARILVPYYLKSDNPNCASSVCQSSFALVFPGREIAQLILNMAGSVSKASIVRALFIVLSVVGFGLLWVSMLVNGTLDAINAVKETGVFPNGRPLRSTYTGIPLLDSQIATLVVFFDGVTNGLDPGPRLLMVDLSVMLQTAAVWVLVESRRKGDQSMLLRL